jgi:Leucine-rich repeat (LRR) protein
VKQSLQNVILDNNCMEQIPTKAFEEMNALIALHLKNNQVKILNQFNYI